MRILDIVSTVDPAQGGPIEGVKQHARLTRERGLVSEVASLDDPAASYVADFPEVLHALGPSLAITGLGTYGYAPRLGAWLAANAAGYDAVIVHGLWQYQTLAVWRALRRTRVPYYVFPHGMLDPWFRRAYPVKHAKKWVYWQAIERSVLRDARAVLFTCEEERLLAQSSFRSYRAREAVVGFGTAATQGNPERELDAFLRAFPGLRGKRLLLFLSRLHPKKGCDNLIASIAEVARRDPELRLVMAGPDQVGWQGELAARARELGVGERIAWTGMLTGDAKWGAYRAAEAFVLPSHQENFGIVVAEALACGVPVLISDKVNIWREIAAAHAGLVGDDTTAGTTALLSAWLDTDRDTRRRMCLNARQCFRQHFDLHTAIDRFHDLLRQPLVALPEGAFR
jgi:glycosyltransferase involved in cell wall biosynthesis